MHGGAFAPSKSAVSTYVRDRAIHHLLTLRFPSKNLRVK
jgi:hypothetical protein